LQIKGLERDKLGLTAIPCDCDLRILPVRCQSSILVHAHRQGIISLADAMQVKRELESKRKNAHGAFCCIVTMSNLLSPDNLQQLRIQTVLLQMHPDKTGMDDDIFISFQTTKHILIYRTAEKEAVRAALLEECQTAQEYIMFLEGCL